MANWEALIQRNTRANQPAFGIAGRIYYVTDEGTLEFDTGSAWVSIDSIGATVGFTPAVLADWDYLSDPGDVKDALDQLAARTTDLEGGVAGVATMYYNGYRSTNQVLTVDVTPFDYDNEPVNLGGAFAGGVFTAPLDGIYMITLGFATTSASIIPALYIDGAGLAFGQTASTSNRTSANFVESLSAGQTAEVRAVGVGGTLDGSNSKNNWMRIVKL